MVGDLINQPEVVKKLKGHKKGVTAVDYSPNEQQIASGSLDNSVLLWDVTGNVRSYRFQGHTEAVMDVTFSPNGKYMASASRDKTVRVWVPTVTGSVGMFKAHLQTVRSVQFSPDNSKILTASDDKTIKLWSSDKHRFISSFVGHTNWVRCAKISNDGSVIASCSDDKTARLWTLDSGEKLHVYKDQKGYGVHLAWHPSGCYIAVGTSYGSVKLYDIRTHNLVQYYSIHSDAITHLAFHPSGSYILTGSMDGKMKVLDLLEGHPIFTLDVHNGSTNAVGFSPSGDSFCSAGEDKFLYVWKTNFTELHQGPEGSENTPQNVPSTVPQTHSGKTPISATSSKARSIWKQCYHSFKYPISTYYHLDDIQERAESNISSEFTQEPNANSTAVNVSLTSSRQMPRRSFIDQSISQQVSQISHSNINEESFVGHISHIPRPPPTPTTFRIPEIANKSTGMDITKIEEPNNSFYGMISLKENDVCYTSGTIEWVGKKRSFPLNSGFKIINEKEDVCAKKVRLNKSCGDPLDKQKVCDCADVLPTVNAIVQHLNALHEAVDLVDLRLSNLEDVVKQ